MVMVTGPRADKALRLFHENRVVLIKPEGLQAVMHQSEAIVAGETGAHVVRADEEGVRCSCSAWRINRACSHALAAMLAWQDAADREHALAEAA